MTNSKSNRRTETLNLVVMRTKWNRTKKMGLRDMHNPYECVLSVTNPLMVVGYKYTMNMQEVLEYFYQLMISLVFFHHVFVQM